MLHATMPNFDFVYTTTHITDEKYIFNTCTPVCVAYAANIVKPYRNYIT